MTETEAEQNNQLPYLKCSSPNTNVAGFLKASIELGHFPNEKFKRHTE